MDGMTDKRGGHGTDWLCAGIDGGTGHRLTDGRATQGGIRARFRGHGFRGQVRPARLGRSLPHLIEAIGALEAVASVSGR